MNSTIYLYLLYWELNLIEGVIHHQNHRSGEISLISTGTLAISFHGSMYSYINRSKIINSVSIFFMLATGIGSVQENHVFNGN